MKQWLFLPVAIVSEVAATAALKAADGFTRFWPSLVVVTGASAARERGCPALREALPARGVREEAWIEQEPVNSSLGLGRSAVH
jgi:hypothetical protein